MFTVCPKCTLTLAVTADDLRVGQGYVRCGRCSNVFNALLKLSDVPDDSEAAPASIPDADPVSTSQVTRALSSAPATAAPASARPAHPALTPASLASPASSPAPSPSPSLSPELSPSLAPSPAPLPKGADADAIDQFELVLQTLGLSLDEDEAPPRPEQAHGPASAELALGSLPEGPTVENIVLEGDEVTQTASSLPGQPVDELDLFARRLGLATNEAPEPSGAALPPPGARPSPSTARRSAPASPPAVRKPRRINRPWMRQESVDAASTLPSAEPDLAELTRPPARHRWAWGAGCLLLLTLLAAQAINHWRDALAASPAFGSALTRLYAALGAPIRPHWDLDAYEVRQQGAEAAGTGAQVIRVRFSLANHAARAQPVPLLRLTLLDRYGKPIEQRDLQPADYWPRGRAPAAFLASDERIDTAVQVRDPSADSASFELDVCLPDAHRLIHCAGDAAPTLAAAP